MSPVLLSSVALLCLPVQPYCTAFLSLKLIVSGRTIHHDLSRATPSSLLASPRRLSSNTARLHTYPWLRRTGQHSNRYPELLQPHCNKPYNTQHRIPNPNHDHSHNPPTRRRRLLRLQLKLLRRRPLLMVVERRTYPSNPSPPSSLNPAKPPPLTDRLRRPLHHCRRPLHPPLRLLRRRLPTRPSARPQKPPPAPLPRLDAAPQHSRPPALLLPEPAHVHQPAKPLLQQPAEPLLRPAATAPG